MLDVEYEPLTGSPDALAGHAGAATRTAERLDDARGRLVGIVRALDGQHSQAVADARARVGDVAERLSLCAGVLRATASTLHRHADRLGTEQVAAALAIARRDDALRREQHWREEADRIRLETLPALVPTPAESAQQHLAEVRVTEARDAAHAAEAEWRRARDAKRTASLDAARSIEALADARAMGRFVGSGESVAAFQRGWARGSAAAGVVDAMRAGDSSSVSGRSRLRRAFAAGDAVFWSAFWAATTPQELYQALDLDPLDEELARVIGTGVVRWSTSATPGELAAFGRSVVDGLMPTGIGLSEQSAVAAVLLSAALPGQVHAAAAEALERRRESGWNADAELAWTAPVTIAVANGLLAHPQAALDHLAPADDELLARRARLWFGLAPPDGWPDAGEAVTGALAAAVLFGSRSPARGDQTRSALLVAHATQHLPGGLLAAPGTSDLASARVARAYEPYVPVFGEAVVDADGERAEPGTRETERRPGGPSASQRAVVQPDLDAFALVDVISATSTSEAAAGVWLGVGDRYHDAMLAAGFGGASGGESGGHEPLDRDLQDLLAQEALRDVGAIAGALQADTMQVARERQGTLDGAVEGASFLAGAVTVHAAPAVSIGVTAATGLVPHLTPDHVAPVKETVLLNEQSLRRRYAEAAYSAAIAAEVEGGMPAARAAERRAALDPDSAATRGAFRQTYDLTADLRRQLGDNR